jgi:ATP-binding cassette subfamily F protein 3
MPVLEDINFEIRGKDRVLVEGLNGSGKTTLLHIAAGIEKADKGVVRVGEKIKIGFFSQDNYGLDNSLSCLENVTSSGVALTNIYRQARSLGFGEKELSMKPEELSRGQQAKLAFLKLLLGQNNLIILDEPTNHLDITTIESIEKALLTYDGSILIASHDAYFLEKLRINKRVIL